MNEPRNLLSSQVTDSPTLALSIVIERIAFLCLPWVKDERSALNRVIIVTADALLRSTLSNKRPQP